MVSNLSQLAQIFSHPSIAVDLGTANTRCYASLHGEVTETPSSISLAPTQTNNVADEYLQYMNKKIALRPLRGGVIVDLANTVTLLKPLVKKSGRLLSAPISLASAPTDSTEKERDLLRRAIMNAGASHVSIIPEVWAAAIGAGVDISLPHAQLLVDIGDGVTDMAVFRDGRIIYSSSIRMACSDLQRAVRSAIMTKYKIQVSGHDIERLTNLISLLVTKEESMPESLNVSGMDIIRRCKVNCWISKIDIMNSIEPVANKIIGTIEKSLQRLPEKAYCEIVESGVCLTGGGACIKGMDRLIAVRTKLNVRVPADPIHAVINGAIHTLNYWQGKKCWWKNIVWPSLST